MDIEVCSACSSGVTTSRYRQLLSKLDLQHGLRDSTFHTEQWLSRTPDDAWTRLVARHEGELVGFLAGQPTTGHISIIGTTEPGRGIGPALLHSFTDNAARAGRATLTVTIDTEPTQRGRRRRFFEHHGFTAVHGSSLHFAKPITNSSAILRPVISGL